MYLTMENITKEYPEVRNENLNKSNFKLLAGTFIITVYTL